MMDELELYANWSYTHGSDTPNLHDPHLHRSMCRATSAGGGEEDDKQTNLARDPGLR